MSFTCDDGRRLLADALPMLQRHVAGDITASGIHLLRDGGRCVVARCVVESRQTDIQSVILKQVRERKDAARFAADWASLLFLTDHPRTAAIAPRLYGGDAETGLIAMEDLGPSRSLDDVLNERDPAAARRALAQLALQTARLQAGTIGDEAAFGRALAGLPGAQRPDWAADVERWVAGLGAFMEWCAAAGVNPPAEFDACCRRLAAEIASPGPLLAFTHGDPAPTNNHVAGETVRLLDFEYGGYRHALYDITAWYVLCPLPEPVVREMAGCYQTELSKTCPAAGDDERFRQAWAALCAYRALAMLSWIRRDCLNEDRPWVNDWSCRSAVLSTVTRLHRVTRAIPELEPINGAAERLAPALRARWPEISDPLPRWPALQSWREYAPAASDRTWTGQ